MATFGIEMNERSSNNENYRYGMNGQEKTDDVSGSGCHYVATFWEMDPRLARRWNLDPIIKQHESPYAIFANSPIWLVDRDGKDTSFSENQTRQQFKDTYNNVDKAINSLNKRIDKQMSKWKEKGYDNERLNNRMSRKIGRLNGERSKLLEIKNSFDEVIHSDVMFFYTARPNPDGKYLSGGGTSYSPENDRVEIWFYSGNSGTLVHETRHGAGYSWGEWAWNNTADEPTNYDYQDEFEAYRQESNYDRLVNGGVGRSTIEIKDVIQDKYGHKSFIIKEFNQYCEPKGPCE